MKEIEFKFSTPHHGWMDVSVRNEQAEITLDISDVPCNSIEILVQALIKLQKGSRYEEVEFSLEPEYSYWKFTEKESRLSLDIYPIASQQNSIIFECPKKTMLEKLYLGLKDLESNPCWKMQEKELTIWSWEFPSEELRRFN